MRSVFRDILIGAIEDVIADVSLRGADLRVVHLLRFATSFEHVSPIAKPLGSNATSTGRRHVTSLHSLSFPHATVHLAVAASLLAFAPSEAAAQSLSTAKRDGLEKIVEAELKHYGAPGMILAIQRGQVTLLRAAYGTANVDTGEPMAPGMMVSVASVSKLVTAVTALIVVSEGLLDLDVPVRTYLPDLPPRLGDVTMTQLLSHKAGLAGLTPRVSPAPDGSIAPVCAAMTDEALVAEPGVTWGYSNTGFTLAGCVMEAVAARPFREVVQTRVFSPLGMSRSTYEPRLAMTYQHAQGHDTRVSPAAVVRPYSSNPRNAPAVGLITTVDDLLKIATALMSDGFVAGRRVMAPGILSAIAQPRATGGPFLNGGRRYGFGIFIREHRGIRVLELEGVSGGFGVSFAMATSQSIAAIAIANGSFASPVRTTQAAIEIALGLDISPTDIVHQDAPLADSLFVVGRYSRPTGSFEIAVVDGRLTLIKGERAYPVLVHPHGHWEVLDHPVFANPLEGRGGLPPAAGSDTALMSMIIYEHLIENFNIGSGAAYFNKRGWGELSDTRGTPPGTHHWGLVEGTPLHYPMPATQLELVGQRFYSYGGVGNEGGSLASAAPVGESAAPVLPAASVALLNSKRTLREKVELLEQLQRQRIAAWRAEMRKVRP